MADLYWAAGFLEGEGSFTAVHAGKRPDGRLRATYNVQVSCGQQNREPLEKLEAVFGGTILYRKLNYVSRKTPEKKHDLHVWYLRGWRGIALMMTLWTLMSGRRRAQIEHAIQRWKDNQSPNGENHLRWVRRGEGHPFAKLTDFSIAEIRSSTETERVLGARYSVSKGTIGKVKRGELWGHKS